MTEVEWLKSDDPSMILDFIRENMTERKLRLVICAACRRHWNIVTKDVFREAVAVAERYANGLATNEERERACRATEYKVQRRSHVSPQPYLRAFHDASCSDAVLSESDWRWRVLSLLGRRPVIVETHLVRDIFGNPFREVKFDPAWRTDTAVALARQMYDSREFTAMPILADALQDAGCDSDDILNHCRDASATHVRGCWVVDLVLGKE